MTTCIAVRCPHCRSHQIVKYDKTGDGTQRDRYPHQTYAAGRFLLDSRTQGWLPGVKQLTIDMSLNASRVRDTAPSLHIRSDTALSILSRLIPSLSIPPYFSCRFGIS